MGYVLLVGLIAFIIFCVYNFIIGFKEGGEDLQRKEEQREKIRKEYDGVKKEFDERLVYYQKHKTYSSDVGLFIIDNKQLCILSRVYDLNWYTGAYPMQLPTVEEKIDLKDIKYFRNSGNKYERQVISGGGGGGSSVGGAVVGGLVAGGTGAIIGSRKKVEEVKTEFKTVDDRRTEIILTNGIVKDYSRKLYEWLLEYIPEKEYDNYIENLKSKGRKDND